MLHSLLFFTLNDLEQVFKVTTTTLGFYDVGLQYAWSKTRARKCELTHLVDLLKPAGSVKTSTWSLHLAQVCFVKALISHVTLTWDIHLLSDFKRHLHRTTTTTTATWLFWLLRLINTLTYLLACLLTYLLT